MTKLEKFDNGKNKNIKNLIIASVIILILISAFVIFKSYALYKIEKQYDVIKAKIGDFSNTDIILNYTIDEEKKNDAFPTKYSYYQALSTTCENGVTAEWNNKTWGLDNINSNGNKQIKCTVNFTKAYLCKRATSLHTDYNNLTYGNLGTKGILENGDAFDCDINRDGVYDSEKERFYYISDYYNTTTKSFESDTAVLIYYHSLQNGEPGIANTVYDNYQNIPNNLNEGPTGLLEQLPTIDQWSNVRLKSETRAILNENGGNTTTNGTLPSEFSYAGCAARLLTYQELTQACGTQNSDNKCYYLTENSQMGPWTYSYWLETATEDNEDTVPNAWVYSWNASTNNLNKKSIIGSNEMLRPVIEVDKINILY